MLVSVESYVMFIQDFWLDPKILVFDGHFLIIHPIPPCQFFFEVKVSLLDSELWAIQIVETILEATIAERKIYSVH